MRYSSLGALESQSITVDTQSVKIITLNVYLDQIKLILHGLPVAATQLASNKHSILIHTCTYTLWVLALFPGRLLLRFLTAYACFSGQFKGHV